jgi:hypothetical protein
MTGWAACALAQQPVQGARTPSAEKASDPPAAVTAQKPAPTLRCTAETATATLSWKPDIELADAPGTFELSFVHGDLKESEIVQRFEPMFDPTTDVVRYYVGWASKEFRTMLRLYHRDGKTFGDYESRAASASSLECTNNLPIRSAEVAFADDDWFSVTTALALIDGVTYRRDGAVTRERETTLRVQLASADDPEAYRRKLQAIRGIRWVRLLRVDGSVVPPPPQADRTRGTSNPVVPR